MKKTVNLKDIKYIRYHDSLSEILVERIKKLYPTISEIFPWSLDEWVDGFNYDREPEKEIQIWEAMVKNFELRCKTQGAKTKEEKIKIFKEILGPPKVVIAEDVGSA